MDSAASQSSTETEAVETLRIATRSAATTNHSTARRPLRNVRAIGTARSVTEATLLSARSVSSAVQAKMENLPRLANLAIGSVHNVKTTTSHSEPSANAVSQIKTEQLAVASLQEEVEVASAEVVDEAALEVDEAAVVEAVEVDLTIHEVVVVVEEEAVEGSMERESHSEDLMQSLRIRKSLSVMIKSALHSISVHRTCCKLEYYHIFIELKQIFEFYNLLPLPHNIINAEKRSRFIRRESKQHLEANAW